MPWSRPVDAGLQAGALYCYDANLLREAKGFSVYPSDSAAHSRFPNRSANCVAIALPMVFVLLLHGFIRQTAIEEGIVGTTKLTRKEILAEDPIRATMVRIVDTLRLRGRALGILAGVIVLLVMGGYFSLKYLSQRELRAQEELGRAMELYHAQIDASAPDDPYSKGPLPVFRNEEAKYKAAGEAFSLIHSGYGSSKVAVIARYYQGLSQMKLGQKEDAVRNLEEVKNNTRDRTLGYLAKKVLATYYMESGNQTEASTILEGMIRDPQCELPKEALRVELVRAYLGAGNLDQARKTLKEAREDTSGGMLTSMLTQEFERLEKKAGQKPAAEQP